MTLPEVIGAIHPLREAAGLSASAPIGNVTTDSREVEANSLFVAIEGERVDGADFVVEAFKRGALAAIVSEAGFRKVPAAVTRIRPVFVVSDPVEALGDLAQAHRLRHRSIPLVAITGSSGKTTTKEMLSCLLSRSRRVLYNVGNRNNLIGMPLTLLDISEEHDAAVLEMGTNAPGEIARLSDIALPDIGLITNIAPAHLEGLGSMEGVAREKGDLFRSLGSEGVAVVNATDLRAVREASRCAADKVFYGVPLNDFHGRILSMSDTRMRIAIQTPAGEFTSAVGASGEQYLINATAATAVAFMFGLRPEGMEEGFAAFSSAPGRFHAEPLRGGGLLLDDSYNANPASVEAALRALMSLARRRRTVAVFGDMLEMGKSSAASHFRVGHLMASLKVGHLFAFGQDAAFTIKGAIEGGMNPLTVNHFNERQELREAVLGFLKEGDVVLVKGSRGMRLDDAAKDIRDKWV
ncbi:MAG: UDP-N-acetylmuramoyl-tripeptide--D-alanyl-D-alanine ligase [Syntrophorhabdaceae bacterium]|nr:UDP-N-acetylmuramoyl-tripeptide--D-alanyl-D-alanine ligase [Syntrophorhabdaceae bacterium]